MAGARPDQAASSHPTDGDMTAPTRAATEGMVDGLNDHRTDDFPEVPAQLGVDVFGGDGWERFDADPAEEGDG